MVAAVRSTGLIFGPGLLFHFHGIGRSVYFYMHVIVFYISHGHLVEISVDFISVFFHGFRYTLEVISYEAFHARYKSWNSTVSSSVSPG